MALDGRHNVKNVCIICDTCADNNPYVHKYVFWLAESGVLFRRGGCGQEGAWGHSEKNGLFEF